jgi:bifunctional DNA-binding transcriptional regulator/antitoxin component of YhaV-PrlF toxin-antitoxin module
MPLGGMTATVSANGQVLLPPELSESAQLQPGDRLEVQFYKGTLVLRKRQPLSPAQCAELLERSRSRPEAGPSDDAVVAETIREARTRRG